MKENIVQNIFGNVPNCFFYSQIQKINLGRSQTQKKVLGRSQIQKKQFGTFPNAKKAILEVPKINKIHSRAILKQIFLTYFYRTYS